MIQPTARQEESIRRYKAFWNRENHDRPMLGFGQPYPAKHLSKSREMQLLTCEFTPDMLAPEEFLPSYEEFLALRSGLPGDLFYSMVPVNGFPWIEAMAGCGIVASGQGYSALHYVSDIDELEKVVLDLDTPWTRKYFDFLDCLGKHFLGRCGAGQPILRGISDLLAAVMGPENMVYALHDEPVRVKAFIRRAVDFYVQLYKEQMRRIPPFLGGYMIGFYDIWAPEPGLWLQDDNLVLFSPEMYGEFFLEFIATVSSLSPYNLIHLHPVCFHNLDLLLGVPTLRVIEVNREMIETGFSGLLAAFAKIRETKLLDVQGLFTPEDLEAVLKTLPPEGLQLKYLVEDVAAAPGIYEFFRGVRGNP